jgi:hypothetical protein
VNGHIDWCALHNLCFAIYSGLADDNADTMATSSSAADRTFRICRARRYGWGAGRQRGVGAGQGRSQLSSQRSAADRPGGTRLGQETTRFRNGGK